VSGSSPLQDVEHTPQDFSIEVAADAYAILARNINLDLLSHRQWLGGDANVLSLNHHWDHLRSHRRARVAAKSLAPLEHLVRIHVVSPGNN
jgi:hypothetical protein